jgi:hypothetical protein
VSATEFNNGGGEKHAIFDTLVELPQPRNRKGACNLSAKGCFAHSDWLRTRLVEFDGQNVVHVERADDRRPGAL